MAIWKRLAHVKLTSAGDTIDTGTFDAAENLKVVYFGISSSGINGYMRFNGFSDQSYSIRLSDSGAADGAYDDRTMLAHDTGTATTNQYSVSYITNQSDQEKIVHGTVINSQGSATNTAPTRRELIGKFDKTNQQITRVQMDNGGSGDFGIGSSLTVFGTGDLSTSDEKTTLTNVEVGTRYEETDTRKIYRKSTPTSALFDYTDGSNTGWSWAGTGFTFDTSDERIEFTEQRSNHRIWYDLGSGNKGDSDFTMRFEINLTSFDSNNGGASMTFVCVSNNGDNLTSTNDSLNAFNYSGNGWRQSTADGQRNDSTSDQTGNLGSISAGDTHYMEMKRSGTTFTLSRYTDSTYSATTWSNNLSIGSGITGLRYIKVQSGYQGNKAGWIDNIKFYETASVSTDEWKERGTA